MGGTNLCALYKSVCINLFCVLYKSILWHCTSNKINVILVFLQDHKTYQNDLRQQMDFQKQLKEFEAAQTRRELELHKEAEILHQMRVQEALAKPHQDKIHPKRLLVAGQGLL